MSSILVRTTLLFLCMGLQSAGLLIAQSDIQQGLYLGKAVTYKLVNGLAIYEGDILLGTPAQLAPPAAGGIGPKGLGTAYSSSLWPIENGVHTVPYVIVNGNTALTSAISTFNSTFSDLIQFTARNGESSYVQFNLNSGDHSATCEANVGLAPPAFQPEIVMGSIDCDQGVLLHEMGHIVGLWHEQARPDRDQFVTVNYSNIIKGSRSNFDQVLDNAQVFGLYDYGSIMHYIPFAFSRNGGPTVESIPAGIPLSTSGATATYTAGDVDAIKRLYLSAPATVTVTSDPPGLQVVVDGSTITTPHVFNWALNSTHTLNSSTAVQTLGGKSYTFGRWNDTAWTGTVQPSHSITVSPGSGLLSNPVTAPAITVYESGFTQLILYTPSSSPAGGTIATNPLPQGIGGNQYFTARQAVQVSATPPAGNAFYSWFGSFDGIIPFGMNPMTTQHLLDNDIGASFTNSTPLTAVGTNLQNVGLGVRVDGTFFYSPKNLSHSEWSSQTTHSLSVDTPQQPYSSDTRYVFSDWGGNSANPLVVNSSPQASSYTANFGAEYRLTKSVNPVCAGSIGVSVAPNGSGFYTAGTALTISETPVSGWTFTGWKFDLSGTASSQPLTMSDEEFIEADFNTVNTSLTISSLSPSIAQAGSNGLTMTITGTGFDPAHSIVFVNGTYNSNRQVQITSSTNMTVQIFSTDLSSTGATQILIENFPSGAPCAAIATGQLFISSPPAITSVSPIDGTGVTSTFTEVIADPAGVADVGAGHLLFNSSLNPAGACWAYYARGANTIYLVNDSGNGFASGSVSPGGSGSASNSQCTISSGGSVIASGNTLMIPVSITFSANFAGTKNVYGYVEGNNGAVSGWQLQGTWITGTLQPPSIASVIPINGSGVTATFSEVINDPAGIADVNIVHLLFNSSLNPAGACWAYYARGTNTIYLVNDAGNGFAAGSVSPGGAGTASNSQCTISSGGAVTTSANSLTMPVAITFAAGFAGTKNVYGYVTGNDGLASGWQLQGTWITGVVQPPSVTSVTPINGSGVTATFSEVINDPAGTADVNIVHLLFNSSLNPAGACWAYYARGTNTIYLVNDAGNGFAAGSVSPGGAGTASNSQCTISSGGAVTTSANSLTMPVAITFAAGFAGTKNVYGYVTGNDGLASGWQLQGTWITGAVQPPSITSVTPIDGTGITATFSEVVTDPAGAADVNGMHLLFNASLNAAGACWVNYVPATSTVYLVNDAGNGYAGSFTPGAGGSVSNSQCTISSGGSVTTSGNMVTMPVSITFLASFGGTRNVYGYATGANGGVSGWQLEGTWKRQ